MSALPPESGHVQRVAGTATFSQYQTFNFNKSTANIYFNSLNTSVEISFRQSINSSFALLGGLDLFVNIPKFIDVFGFKGTRQYLSLCS